MIFALFEESLLKEHNLSSASKAGSCQQVLYALTDRSLPLVLQIVYCTESMVNRSLWEAVHTRQPDLKAIKVNIKSSVHITGSFD